MATNSTSQNTSAAETESAAQTLSETESAAAAQVTVENYTGSAESVLSDYMSGAVTKTVAVGWVQSRLDAALDRSDMLEAQTFSRVRREVSAAQRPSSTRRTRSAEDYGNALLLRIATLESALSRLTEGLSVGDLPSDVPSELAEGVIAHVRSVIWSDVSGTFYANVGDLLWGRVTEGAASDTEREAAQSGLTQTINASADEMIARSLLRASGTRGKLQAHLDAIAGDLEVGAVLTFSQIARTRSEVYPTRNSRGEYVSPGAVARAFGPEARTAVVGWTALEATAQRGQAARLDAQPSAE